MINTPTLKTTLERILETQQVTDNIWIAVATGEITEQQAIEILDEVLALDADRLYQPFPPKKTAFTQSSKA